MALEEDPKKWSESDDNKDNGKLTGCSMDSVDTAQGTDDGHALSMVDSDSPKDKSFRRGSLFFNDFDIEALLGEIVKDEADSESEDPAPCRRRITATSLDDFFNHLEAAMPVFSPPRTPQHDSADESEEDPVRVVHTACTAFECAASGQEWEMRARDLEERLESSERARLEALEQESKSIRITEELRAELEELKNLHHRSVKMQGSASNDPGSSFETWTDPSEGLCSLDQDGCHVKMELSESKDLGSSFEILTNSFQPGCLAEGEAKVKRVVEELRLELKASKEACRSLLQRLRGDVAYVRTGGEISLLQRLDDLEGENARLEDRAKQAAALYVPKIQQLEADLQEAQLELCQALESQEMLQADNAAKARMIHQQPEPQVRLLPAWIAARGR